MKTGPIATIIGDDDMRMMNSLSPLEMLASVAEKVYEFEHQFDPTVDVTVFKKKPLPFDLNLKPCTCGRPRSSPIDVDDFLPCLHHKRKPQHRDDDDENDSGELGFARASKKMKLTVRLQLPELSLEYRQKISDLGGSDPRLVTEKKLRKSDVSSKKGRLKMPYSKRLDDFGEIKEMKVKVYHQLGSNVSETFLTFTRSCADSSFVFAGSWNSIVEASNLKKDDVVQVWSFRQDEKLSFALIKL
ncbi:hypothetical protein vseg_020525 [Gypsophila vaccaria]